MAGRTNNPIARNGYEGGRRPPDIYRRPFWLPTASYYFLSFAVAAVAFFLVWAVLLEGGEPTPWITAGVLSGLILISAVIVREVFLRKARNRYLAARRQLDYNLSRIPRRPRAGSERPKFTLQQNAAVLGQIEEKSEAARVLRRVPDGHLEVFELCNEYLNFTKRELKRVDVNSPRFPVIKKSRSRVRRLHRYHLLKWAEIETKRYTREAAAQAATGERLTSARKALGVLESALGYYPGDKELTASRGAVTEFISRTRITDMIAEADRLSMEERFGEAISRYRDILFVLNEENLPKRDKTDLAENISAEIKRLRLMRESAEPEE